MKCPHCKQTLKTNADIARHKEYCLKVNVPFNLLLKAAQEALISLDECTYQKLKKVVAQARGK